jgi:DNA excision repair protein ERCC-3
VANNPANPLIVQSDYVVLVEVDSPRYLDVRDRLIRFAELVKSPEHIHTYRITPLSIWNACAAGVGTAEIVETLHEYSKYPVPDHIAVEIRDQASRYGRIKIIRDNRGLVLTTDDPTLAEEISRKKEVAAYLHTRLSPVDFLIDTASRGIVKQGLVKAGFPAEDIAGYVAGDALAVELRPRLRSGAEFTVRQYQREAASVFHSGGSNRGGSGVIVLPCGAGKTVVGITCMALVRATTLILTTSVTAVRQWIAELLDKTNLPESQVGEYSGVSKVVRPVTVSTYQIMTYSKDGRFPHLSLFDAHNWGLIVYDEVHLLPAPVFQITASLQARRRLGLTATLVREDGRESDVFALIGPKRVDVPWKEMESQGWIATALCTEIRLPLPEKLRMPYAIADKRDKFRIASENPAKLDTVEKLIARHVGEQIVIIGMYIQQLKKIAALLDAPILTGSTSQVKRDAVFADFRGGRIRALVVSKIANFAVDLPDASVAIQISGNFGSRQEEAQRLGRILRPKADGRQAHFYTVVSRDTCEQEFALKRQLFLCEQGYQYAIVDAEEVG